MKSNFTVMEECGLYRVVCTDYDREEYLPSVFINRSGAQVIDDVCSGKKASDQDSAVFMKSLLDLGFVIEEDIQE